MNPAPHTLSNTPDDSNQGRNKRQRTVAPDETAPDITEDHRQGARTLDSDTSDIEQVHRSLEDHEMDENNNVNPQAGRAGVYGNNGPRRPQGNPVPDPTVQPQHLWSGFVRRVSGVIPGFSPGNMQHQDDDDMDEDHNPNPEQARPPGEQPEANDGIASLQATLTQGFMMLREQLDRQYQTLTQASQARNTAAPSSASRNSSGNAP
ncbi:hypothetical protein EDD85DRAFT_963209 [Armillaria nabsnona]|nr:hypothetical protein EDD85DRAFT_963209 [Armillaria nabsnona]